QTLVELIEAAGGSVKQGVRAVIQSKAPVRLLCPNTEQPSLLEDVVVDAVRVIPKNVVVPTRGAVQLDGQAIVFRLLGSVVGFAFRLPGGGCPLLSLQGKSGQPPPGDRK